MQTILNLCTCPQAENLQKEKLKFHISQFTHWDALPTQAEEQGLGPLVCKYLSEIDIDIPRQHKIALQGLYLRHRHTNKVRCEVLSEILSAFRTAKIDVLVLKGAALAYLIYEEIGLRPMRDLDLLVRKADLIRAREVIIELGFDGLLEIQGKLPDKHLKPVSRITSGFSNSIELHYDLLDSFAPRSITFEAIRSEPLVFECNGVKAYTLGPEDMLLHLCEHISYHASIWEPIRLIWVTDVVGFSEKFVDKIDWQIVQDCYPIVLKMLSLFHHICPLSKRLQEIAQIKIGPSPAGIGEEFKGWPRHSFAHLRRQTYQEMIRDTFFPSEWWLRLHYRLDSTQSLFWYRCFFHPLYILGPFYIVEKIKLFWYLNLRKKIMNRQSYVNAK